MSCVVAHALQAALGDSCDIHGLRARLQVLQQLLRGFSNAPALAGCLGETRGGLAGGETPQAPLQPQQPQGWAGTQTPFKGKAVVQQSQSLEPLV